MSHDVVNRDLVQAGAQRIDSVERNMPALRRVRERFAVERPLEELRIAVCMPVTAETANALRTLHAGGAELALASSNPLLTQEDTAAALVEEYGVAMNAWAGPDAMSYEHNLTTVLDSDPHLLLDDGCDLVNIVHLERPELLDTIVGGCEQTTAGVTRLRGMCTEGILKLPMVAVSESYTKQMMDNRFGTGQSTVDGIMRATGSMLAGCVVVVAGFGMCGRGLAERFRGMGTRVVVTEVDPARALDAVLQGYTVLPMAEAAAIGDVFVTVTGNRDVIRAEHIARMKNGAVLANSGHFDVEIHSGVLADLSVEVNFGVCPQTDEYVLDNGRRVFLLSEGYLVNLGAGEGNPPEVMDMSLSVKALTVEWLAQHHADMSPCVLDVPATIDAEAARLELATLDVGIDHLTPDQKEYLHPGTASRFPSFH
ncbi:adenosylhomocysteinase [Lipingzhangella sp. LS1_29]|uniref:Adenosylhomocysteinase n=1 Tax=Lipingzhangella rawalii TaxID=2055835 RepID=A0ABU2HBG4_9ACTN|nr:adenosylhomocysteinase [Lipingzhangella rawalii]